MQLELKGSKGTLYALGVERGFPYFSAQMAVTTTAMPRGEVLRVMDPDKPVWRQVKVTLLSSLPSGWSAYNCDPGKEEFTRLDFPVSLKVEKG